MKLKDLFEASETFSVVPVIKKLKSDLISIGVNDPNFQAGFCFHAAYRIYEALHSKFPSHNLSIIHDGGHVIVYDYDTDVSYDSTGSGKGEGWHQLNRPTNNWTSKEAFLKFLNRRKKFLSPEQVEGLTVL